MRRRQIFVDSGTGEAVVLPISPPSYAWENGINIEQVTVDQLGDLNLGGHKRLDNRSVECIFPARRYAFCEPEARETPYWYVEWFERRCQARTVLRYIVSGTPLNAACLLESIRYGEDDGTNDLKVTLTLRQYRRPEVLPAEGETAAAGGQSRENPGAVTAPLSYTVRAGDTLSAISRTAYGDSNLYGKLAASNHIANPDLIYPGQVLTLPPAADLPAAKTLPPSAKAARATTTVYQDDAKRWTMQLAKEEAVL